MQLIWPSFTRRSARRHSKVSAAVAMAGATLFSLAVIPMASSNRPVQAPQPTLRLGLSLPFRARLHSSTWHRPR